MKKIAFSQMEVINGGGFWGGACAGATGASAVIGGVALASTAGWLTLTATVAASLTPIGWGIVAIAGVACAVTAYQSS